VLPEVCRAKFFPPPPGRAAQEQFDGFACRMSSLGMLVAGEAWQV